MTSVEAARSEVLGAFRSQGLRTGLHVTLRWATAPLARVEALLPAGGRILDVGCGHGSLALVAARRSPQRTVVGVDVDGAKIDSARAAAARLGLADRVRFDVVDAGWRPDDGELWDAVVCTDVLYLLGRAVAEPWVRAMASAVAPGGRVVIKEMATSPRWKVSVNHLQELLATRVLGYTTGATVELVPEEVLLDALAGGGLRTQSIRMDRRWPHPHLAIVGDRPPDDGEDPGPPPTRSSRGDATDAWRQSYLRVRKDPFGDDQRTNRARLAALGVDRLARSTPLLDLGCGDGNLAATLSSLGFEAVVGIEPQPELLAVHPEGSRRIRGSATHLPLADASMGGVIVMDVLHHLTAAEVAEALVEVRRVLRPAGHLFVCEPAATPIRAVLTVALDSPLGSLTQFSRDKREMVDDERETLEPWLRAEPHLRRRLEGAGFVVESLRRGPLHLTARLRRAGE